MSKAWAAKKVGQIQFHFHPDPKTQGVELWRENPILGSSLPYSKPFGSRDPG